MDDAGHWRRTEPPTLIGRAAEVNRLEGFLGSDVGHGEALVITGEAGVGKTALLDHSCRTAATAGTRTLRAAGVQFEAEVSFAGLNQLFLLLHDQLGDLGEAHERALSAALGIGAGPRAGRLVVSAAALALLRHVARHEPVLVVLDDVQWLDPSSASVLAFVARRLEPSPIRLLAAARSHEDCFLLHAGLPRLELPPLDERAAEQLLASRFPGLAASVRRRVLSAAQGNPLALLELPESMTEDERRAVAPLPPVLSLSDQLQALYAGRVRDLPARTRRLLLLAALDGTGELAPLRAGSSGDGWLDDLAPAEQCRLVRIEPSTNRVAFRHPLIGAAVVELATTSERRRAHALLADLLRDDPERRAWHLAEAVVGRQEPAAELLELAADRALHKGDAVRAVHALLRAADLSPLGADRARRLAAAAYLGADAAGRLSSVPELLTQARRANPDSGASLEVTAAAAYRLLNGEGDVDTAHLMLVRAIQRAREQEVTGRALDEALHSLMVVCHFGGREEPWQPFDSVLADLGGGTAPLLSVSAQTYGEPVTASASALDRLDQHLATLDEEVDPIRIVRVAIAAFYVDRLAACRSALWRVVQDGRDGGAAASAVSALTLLAHEAYREGRWDEAARTADEGIAWSEQLGYRLIALPGLYCQALLAAARGDDEGTRRVSDELLAWAAPRGATMLEHFAHRARAVAALGRGDYEEAYRLTASISAPGRLGAHVPVAMWAAKDLVEAALRTGRSAQAAAHVAAMQRAEVFRLRPRLALLATGAAALVASGTDADRLYVQALTLTGAEQFPFERARLQLSYGEHLRRSRASAAARQELTAALETFQRLGARPWVVRTMQELRAAGQTHRPQQQQVGSATLTPQEQEIASLAASGLSNKQIGCRLYLSPRTVSGHLYRIFPKLGVASRAALRDALSQAPPTSTRR